MKVSYNWLKQYLDFDLSPEALSELLTGCGLEVEGLGKWQSVKGGLTGVLIGEVKTCIKHPNADKLSLTTVDIGKGNLLPIVCGAPNVAAGQKVLVATTGTILYSGEESFEIKKTKIRGEFSEGMICAEDELGLGTSHEGIMVLDPSAKTGMSASEYFEIEEDFVFEIGLTPNRTDAMSHIGVARDIKAVMDNLDFIKGGKSGRKMNLPSIENFKTENTNLDIDVVVENTSACPRYMGVTLTGIEVTESPDWLKNRLNAIGLRPINNIVDITNFVLHETGQPLHAFDADEITGNKVVVKKLPAGTTFITLDEEERKLTADDLMICNAKEGMCIGGVFGGIRSGVTQKTKNIFLESAFFDPLHIRRTSKHHDLQTDASFRFERGVDPEMAPYALKRAALLIKKIAGGTISSEVKDVYPKPFEKITVPISWSHIERLIGKAIGKDVIRKILLSLDFEIDGEDNNGLLLKTPLYRVDVTREADVTEEILRIYGYNNVEIPNQLRSSVSFTKKPDRENIRNLVADYLSANEFREIMNNSLTKSVYYENNPDFSAERSVPLLNPLSRDLNVMRQTLLYGGLETLIYNMNWKNFDLKLFEFGSTYKKMIHPDKNKGVLGKYEEPAQLSIWVTGRKEKESWKTSEEKVDFYFIKAISGNLLGRLGISWSILEQKENSQSYLSEGMEFWYQDRPVLILGKISKKVLNDFDIKQDVLYAEFYWELLLKLSTEYKVGFRELPKFPEVRRDLALLLDKNIPYAEIEKLAYQVENKLLKSVNLFDVYEGKNIEPGKKSYAISFILQDEEKTLTDQVIDRIMNKMMKTFEEKLNAKIR
ncbi:MAG: phenylalanine--tRNA ligase subunit beta [Bacteroidales bacterium]|nr:phenylalanine--tRNA ligase subunit beta [Bacteroidales bacterium]